MAIRDYLPSFLRREQEASAALLGELTPGERQRLNSTEKDPIDYWERVGDKTLLSADIINSMPSASQQENEIMTPTKQDGLSALDGTSRELVAAAANAIQKVDWTYDRSPDPDVRREGFKHMRAAIYALDAVVTHGGNLRVEYAMDAVDAVKQHTLRTEAASAIWQHHAPKMASETKEYYRPDWYYPESLHAHSWDIGKITAMGQEPQSARPVTPTVERVADPMHDARREPQAHRATQAQRDAARAQAAPSMRSDADRASAAAQVLAVAAASL